MTQIVRCNLRYLDASLQLLLGAEQIHKWFDSSAPLGHYSVFDHLQKTPLELELVGMEQFRLRNVSSQTLQLIEHSCRSYHKLPTQTSRRGCVRRAFSCVCECLSVCLSVQSQNTLFLATFRIVQRSHDRRRAGPWFSWVSTLTRHGPSSRAQDDASQLSRHETYQYYLFFDVLSLKSLFKFT